MSFQFLCSWSSATDRHPIFSYFVNRMYFKNLKQLRHDLNAYPSQPFFVSQTVRNETGHYGTELFSEVAERIIDTHNKSEPLYLYLAQQGVHSANGHEPLQAPLRLIEASDNHRRQFSLHHYRALLFECHGNGYPPDKSLSSG